MKPPGFWRSCRVCFRWMRIVALLLVLAAVCIVVWFNQIGLPDFFKTRQVEYLRERGWDLEFTRMRLRFGSGIVAENVRLGGAQPASPALSLAEIQLQLDFTALLQRQLQVDGLGLHEGKLIWPVSDTKTLRLEHIRTQLRFQTNDTWSLDNFTADFAGAKLALSGEIQHAPELRSWEMFRGSRATHQTARSAQLEQFFDLLAQIHFEGTPLLNLTVNGDARDLHSFAIRLKAYVPAAQTPWFNAQDFQLAANLTAPASAPIGIDPAWSFWTNLQPYRLGWTVHLAKYKSEKLAADSLDFGGFWSAPELVVTNLAMELGGGRLDAALKLNVATRALEFTNAASFNLFALAKLLTEKTRARLSHFMLTEPPSWSVSGALILPAWTNKQPDWNHEVRPTLQLAGELAVTNATVFDTQIDSTHTHFSCSNLVWELPDFTFAQGNTHLAISGRADETAKDFRVRVQGRFDPETVRPFLNDSNAAHAFALVRLKEPLAFDVTAGGCWTNFASLAAQGNLALTNFAVREEHYGDLTTEVSYSNRVLTLQTPKMHTGEQTATADSVTLDFNQRLIFFTNGLTFALPELVVHAIGPKTSRLVAPYHFFTPPTTRVNGQILLGGMNGGPEMAKVDMRFDIIKGAPFQWTKLKSANLAGTVFWRGQSLQLSNVAGEFCGGKVNGAAYFDFRVPHDGGDYNFNVNLADVDFHSLAVDLWSSTNQLAGTLSGTLTVTSASTESVQSWRGFGEATLRDGLLWDIPLFGIFSPVLNSVSPGLGRNRATEATGKFTMTNGVIFTDSLLIRLAMSRLEYVGTIDLQQNVDARVAAQMLRNTWVVGPLVSTVLWPVSKLFEYRVTGPLNNPKSEPLYVLPKLLMVPLHPFRTLEEILPMGNASTNPPPEVKPRTSGK